jgi:hypothetical protein
VSSSVSDLTQHDRSAHEASCPCKLCVTFDVELAKQEGLRTDLWRQSGLEQWIAKQRLKDLNWNLPVAHCILCGGSSLRSSTVMEHYEHKRWNEKEVQGRIYTSLLVHKTGWQIASYKSFLALGRQSVTDWACNYLDLSPLPCIGIASKEHEEWVEIRLGFIHLQVEDYEQRLARRTGRGELARSGSAP